MKSSNMVVILGSVAALGLLAWYARNRLVDAGTADTRAVTKTGTAGIAQAGVTRTTPLHDVAYAAPASTLQLLAQQGGKLLERLRLPSLTLPSQGDKLQPQKNAVSATAAYTSPLRADYRQSAYSKV